MRIIEGRTFPIGRLFFRYLCGGPLESEVSVERLTELLTGCGFIRLVDNGTRYEELPPFRRYSHRMNFIKNFEKILERYNNSRNSHIGDAGISTKEKI